MKKEGPTTEAEFREALNELVLQAYENDVSIDNGGYEIRQDFSDIPDLEIMVYRLKKQGRRSE